MPGFSAFVSLAMLCEVSGFSKNSLCLLLLMLFFAMHCLIDTGLFGVCLACISRAEASHVGLRIRCEGQQSALVACCCIAPVGALVSDTTAMFEFATCSLTRRSSGTTVGSKTGLPVAPTQFKMNGHDRRCLFSFKRATSTLCILRSMRHRRARIVYFSKAVASNKVIACCIVSFKSV